MPGTNSDRLSALFRKYYAQLHRYARGWVGVSTDADDLVQAAFLKAHCYMCNGNAIRKPRSFLFVTVRNLVNDRYHKQKDSRVDSTIDVDQVVSDSAAPSVERQVMSEREFQNLCVAITQLPERMREAFVLRKVYGYSCQEIGKKLGRSTNTVREQVAQGFKKLLAQRDPEKGRKQLIGRTSRLNRE